MLIYSSPNSWTKSRQKSQEFSSLLFTVTSTALPWDFYFFKLTQPLTVSTVQFLYTIKEKGGTPDRKPYHLSETSSLRTLKIMSRNLNAICMFMNSATVQDFVERQRSPLLHEEQPGWPGHCWRIHASSLHWWACTEKKVSGFPVPSRDVTYQTLPGRE